MADAGNVCWRQSGGEEDELIAEGLQYWHGPQAGAEVGVIRDVLAFVQADTTDAVLVVMGSVDAMEPLDEVWFRDGLADGEDDIGLRGGFALPLVRGEAVPVASVDVLLDEDVERDEDEGGLVICALDDGIDDPDHAFPSAGWKDTDDVFPTTMGVFNNGSLFGGDEASARVSEGCL